MLLDYFVFYQNKLQLSGICKKNNLFLTLVHQLCEYPVLEVGRGGAGVNTYLTLKKRSLANYK